MRISVDPAKVFTAFGTALRKFRKAARLSQEKLIKQAVEAGVERPPNRTFISSLENGHQEPGLITQFKLALAIGVRPSEMLRKAEDMLLPPSVRQRMDRNAAAKIYLKDEKCRKCKTVYEKYVEPLKSWQRGKFKCPRCKHVLAGWAGTSGFTFETKHWPKSRSVK